MLDFQGLLLIAHLCGSQQYAGPTDRLSCARSMILCFEQKPKYQTQVEKVINCVKELGK